MINKVLIVLCVSIVFVLGYWAYLDTQNKRHQELMRIIQEAEKICKQLSEILIVLVIAI